MSRRILCPKCRALGSSVDCTDLINHGEPVIDPQDYELEMTLTLAVPVTSALDMDPHQMASHMRESWVEDPGKLLEVLREAMVDDYELAVRPVTIL